MAQLAIYAKTRINKDNTNYKPCKSIRKLQKRWSRIEYLIIDEVSMISLSMLDDINFNLNTAKDSMSVKFGNISILFVGGL